MDSVLLPTFGSLADAFIVTDDDWRIVYANPAAERYWEMAADELLGETPWDQWPLAERARVEQEHRHALDENQPVELWRSSGKAGEQWAELRACSSEIGIILHYHDLTEQKRREHELSERMRQLSDFIENGTLALHWVAEDGTILWANNAELRLLGYSLEEYVGHNIVEFHIDQPVIFDILGRLKRNEELREYESRLRCKDGSIKNVSINSSVYWENGRFVHTRCFTRDISEREKASEIREHLASIVDSSDDAIISKDLDGIIRSWNRGAERLFGYTAQEIIGKHISTLAALDRVDEIPGILDQIKRGARVDHYETKRRTKDGRILTVSLTVSPIRDASGAVVGASKVARDMTERQLQEQLLREMNTTLGRSNADLEQFAYSASHDLQEPLRIVSSYSEMLRKKVGGKLGEAGDTYIGYIIEGVSRMEQLLQDLRAYAQASTADQSASAVADAEAAFEKALVSLQAGIRSSCASVKRTALPKVRAHEFQLQQLLQNLIGNAIRYRSSAPPGIQVSAERRGAEWVFSVRDNGIGIDPQYQEQIFGIFKRLHTSVEYPGTGMGLAICQRIVQRLGGRIWVESKPGQGSTFFFTIPAGEEHRGSSLSDQLSF